MKGAEAAGVTSPDFRHDAVSPHPGFDCRFYTLEVINGQKNDADGPIKTFTLRGIKGSPPYLHDGRLLTLDDTVEFFNLVLQLKLNAEEKQALVAYMRAL